MRLVAAAADDAVAYIICPPAWARAARNASCNYSALTAPMGVEFNLAVTRRIPSPPEAQS